MRSDMRTKLGVFNVIVGKSRLRKLTWPMFYGISAFVQRNERLRPDVSTNSFTRMQFLGDHFKRRHMVLTEKALYFGKVCSPRPIVSLACCFPVFSNRQGTAIDPCPSVLELMAGKGRQAKGGVDASHLELYVLRTAT